MALAMAADTVTATEAAIAAGMEEMPATAVMPVMAVMAVMVVVMGVATAAVMAAAMVVETAGETGVVMGAVMGENKLALYSQEYPLVFTICIDPAVSF